MDRVIVLGEDQGYVEARVPGVLGSPFFGRTKEEAVRAAVMAVLLQVALEVDDGLHPVGTGLELRVRVA